MTRRSATERKRRTREHVLADLSANYVEKQALLCWFTVERVRLDYGIDLIMQMTLHTNQSRKHERAKTRKRRRHQPRIRPSLFRLFSRFRDVFFVFSLVRVFVIGLCAKLNQSFNRQSEVESVSQSRSRARTSWTAGRCGRWHGRRTRRWPPFGGSGLMAFSDIPFAKVRALLLGLGFDERMIEGKHLGFYHTASDTLFAFRMYGPRDRVSRLDFADIRKQLDLRGLLGEEAFEAALRKASA
jgi:hypothetical protein